ncbi:MAG: hypothetical protein HY556_06765 [Euryarchaeota archaeon]|nr:hypothetical protein [Euryarchaeota archaeon]
MYVFGVPLGSPVQKACHDGDVLAGSNERGVAGPCPKSLKTTNDGRATCAQPRLFDHV